MAYHQAQRAIPAHTCRKKLSLLVNPQKRALLNTQYPCLCNNSRQEQYSLNLVEKKLTQHPFCWANRPRSCKSSILLKETHPHCTHILVTSKGIGGTLISNCLGSIKLPWFHQLLPAMARPVTGFVHHQTDDIKITSTLEPRPNPAEIHLTATQGAPAPALPL